MAAAGTILRRVCSNSASNPGAALALNRDEPCISCATWDKSLHLLGFLVFTMEMPSIQ